MKSFKAGTKHTLKKPIFCPDNGETPKTYAKTWPHHYIVRNRIDKKLFLKMVKHIRRYGYEGWFYKMRITYFDEDGLVYWTMGDPINETDIINRCPKEDTYEYRLKKGTLP